LLGGVACRTETITNVDLDRGRVVYRQSDGRIGVLDYDHVVLACGRSVNLGLVPGMSDHAFPLKTIGDALALRAQVIDCLERAETCEDPVQRRWLSSFVVVGGGFSGIEVAGEINDLVRESRRFYPRIGADEITVTVVHSGRQILPEISPELRDYADRKMRRAGVDIVLEAAAAAVTAPRGRRH